MSKQTLYVVSECDMSLSRNSIVLTYPDKFRLVRPIEDVAFVIVDHHSVHITIPLLNALSDNGTGVVFCNENHMPVSMLQILDSNYMQGLRFRNQLEMSKPMQKQLWQQIIVAKIRNQSLLLSHLGRGENLLKPYFSSVKSGDSSNREGLAAKMYWRSLFGREFIRDRYGNAPNNMLNYGYSILRVNVARSLMGAGLLPAIGIFHHNRYNAFPLADDMMEPFRPYIDEKVYELFLAGKTDLDRSIKTEIVSVFYERLSFDIICDTVNSLVRCYEGESKLLSFPSIF